MLSNAVQLLGGQVKWPYATLVSSPAWHDGMT